MPDYSKTGPHGPDHEPDAEKNFAQRMEAFFSGQPMPKDGGELSVGLTSAKINARIEREVLAELDDLLKDENTVPITARLSVFGWTDEEVERVREEAVRIWDEVEVVPVSSGGHQTPYERAFQQLREAEAALAATAIDDPSRNELLAEVARARRTMRTEAERAVDENWQGRRKTDEWRAGEGRDTYNAIRRKVRDRPNTPRAVLAAMTPEERKEHEREKDRERKRRKRAAKKEG